EAAGDGGGEGEGEDNVDVRLCSPALSACPSRLQTVTGMHTNAVDARRAMALVEQAEADGGPDGYTPTVTSLSAEAAAAVAATESV
ncbi:unnamed protein product, partial [Laminaria digitata]